MKVRYTITNVQFVPGNKTADVSTRARLGEAFLNESFVVPVESIASIDSLAAQIDSAFITRCGFPADTEFETVAFSQRATLGL